MGFSQIRFKLRKAYKKDTCMGHSKTRVSGETEKKPLPGFVLFATTSKSPQNVELPNNTPELGHMPVLAWIPTLGPHTMAGTVPALANVSPGDPTRERPAGFAHVIGKSHCLEGHRTEASGIIGSWLEASRALHGALAPRQHIIQTSKDGSPLVRWKHNLL